MPDILNVMPDAGVLGEDYGGCKDERSCTPLERAVCGVPAEDGTGGSDQDRAGSPEWEAWDSPKKEEA